MPIAHMYPIANALKEIRNINRAQNYEFCMKYIYNTNIYIYKYIDWIRFKKKQKRKQKWCIHT